MMNATSFVIGTMFGTVFGILLAVVTLTLLIVVIGENNEPKNS